MGISLINFVAPTGSGFGFFLTKCILWFAEVTSSIAAAVIIFTIILKLITLPADIYSRVSMRKNSMIMEQMRPELEKLQKQYANDKVLYQQKVNALYKKNGYSMLGACLPSIVTLVIFFVAIGAFQDFSLYKNRTYVYEMSLSYNEFVYDGFKGGEDYLYYDSESNTFVIEKEKIVAGDQIKNATADEVYTLTANGEPTDIKFKKYETTTTTGTTTTIITNVDLWVDGGYSGCTVNYDAENNAISYDKNDVSFFMLEGEKDEATGEIISKLKDKKVTIEGVEYSYNEFDDTALREIYYETIQNRETVKIYPNKEKSKEVLFAKEVGAAKAAETYHKNVNKFLWVKNIWVADSSCANPVDKSPTNIADPESCGNCSGCICSSLAKGDWKGTEIEREYTELIYKLEKEKSEPNGYFILVILTAGTSLALQLITSKSQKAQAELQTVDGQGAMQQKMMTWMMPIMMAVFAFMYTAAFSIYIILSSVISIGTTLLINFILDKKFKPSLEGDNRPKDVIRGRVYSPPKEEPKKETKKKKSKKNEIADNDFLSGKADKKKPKSKKK